MEITVGFSPCPNDTFLFDAMVAGKVDLEDLVPNVLLEDVETLNGMAMKQTLDITKLSYHAYSRLTDKYIMLSCGSALGRGCGPLLIAAKKYDQDQLSQLRVAVPGQWTTAHFLLNFAYPQDIQKVHMPFHEIEDAVLSGRCDAGVIIHENRFTYASRGLVLIRDLGAHWEDRTGCPIPLGGIAARRSLPPETIYAMERIIRRSLHHAWRHTEDTLPYVRSHAQELDDAVIKNHIALYVNHYTDEMGPAGRKAVDILVRSAAGEGVKLTRPLILSHS